MLNIGYVNSRTDDVGQPSAGCVQRGFDVPERLSRLRSRVANANQVAVGARGRCAGNVNDVARSHGSAVAYDGFPGSTAGDIQTRHGNPRFQTRVGLEGMDALS